MRRLFLRFYLSILAVLFVAWFIHGYVLRSRADSDRVRVILSAHRGGARIVSEQLADADPGDRSNVLQKLQASFKYPVAIKAIQDLPTSVAAIGQR